MYLEKLNKKAHSFDFFQKKPNHEKLGFWGYSIISIYTLVVMGCLFIPPNYKPPNYKSENLVTIEKSANIVEKNLNKKVTNLENKTLLISQMKELIKIKFSKKEMEDKDLISKKIQEQIGVPPKEVLISKKSIKLMFKTPANTDWNVKIQINSLNPSVFYFDFEWNNVPSDVASLMEDEIYSISKEEFGSNDPVTKPLQSKVVSYIDSETKENGYTKHLETQTIAF